MKKRFQLTKWHFALIIIQQQSFKLNKGLERICTIYKMAGSLKNSQNLKVKRTNLKLPDLLNVSSRSPKVSLKSCNYVFLIKFWIVYLFFLKDLNLL